MRIMKLCKSIDFVLSFHLKKIKLYLTFQSSSFKMGKKKSDFGLNSNSFEGTNKILFSRINLFRLAIYFSDYISALNISAGRKPISPKISVIKSFSSIIFTGSEKNLKFFGPNTVPIYGFRHDYEFTCRFFVQYKNRLHLASGIAAKDCS